MASVPNHHVKEEHCITRPSYREGREPKAIKSYTVSSESKYLLIRGVPINQGPDLAPIFSIHGEIDELQGIGDYPCKEEFTEVFLIKFKHIQSARYAKRKMDELAFFGGCLHVCYAPEYETVAETRRKLQDRRRIIALKTKKREDTKNDRRQPSSAPKTLLSVEGTDIKATPLPHQNHTQEPWKTSQIPPISFPNTNIPPPPLPVPCGSLQQPPPPLPCFSLPPPSYTSLPPPTTTTLNTCPPSTPTPTPLPPLPQSIYPKDSPEQLWLAPPPQYCSKTHISKTPLTIKFAKVPSAQAAFPAGFDARINTASNSQCQPKLTEGPAKSEPSTAVSLIGGSSQVKQPPLTQSTTEPIKSVSRNKLPVTQGYSSTHVIRHFQKISVPKFVPRQVLPAKTNKKNPEQDKLDKALRASAVVLGDVQGPEVPAELQPVDKKLEKSLEKTRNSIRKRVFQISDDTPPVVNSKTAKPS